MTCKRANTVGPFRRVRPCPDPWQTGDFGGRLGWAAGCLHPTVHLYWPPLKHPRCLIHHQAISKRSLEYIGLTHIRHIVKMFWAMKCPELAELWWISDIMMQGFRIVRLCARNPRNVCLTFPCFLATNLSMPACPKLLTSQKKHHPSPGTFPTPPTSRALNILKTQEFLGIV